MAIVTTVASYKGDIQVLQTEQGKSIKKTIGFGTGLNLDPATATEQAVFDVGSALADCVVGIGAVVRTTQVKVITQEV